MKRMLGSIAATTLVGALALTACSSNSGNETGTGGDTGSGTEGEAAVNEDGTVNNPEAVEVDPNKLVFWSLFSGGDGGFMDEIITECNGSGPAQEVQPVMLVWADYYTKLTTAVATGNGPDIGVSHISKLPELVEKGIVIPIDEYADAAGTSWDDYPTNSVDGVTFDGSKYAIPLDTHAEILYVNKDLAEAAGVPLNAQGGIDVSSAEELDAILTKFKDSVGDGKSALALTQKGDDPYRVWWATYFQMGGTPVLSEDGSEITLDQEKATEAAEYVKSLWDDGYIEPGIEDHQMMFQEGSAGLVFTGTWAVGAFEKTPDLSFAPQLFPSLFGSDQAQWADSHVLVIPKNDKRTDEETQNAVDFINYVAGDGGLTWAQSGQIPANSTVTDSAEFKELPFREDYVQARDLAVLPAKSVDFYALKDAMIKNLDTLWAGQVDAQQAISNMLDEMESNLG